MQIIKTKRSSSEVSWVRVCSWAVIAVGMSLPAAGVHAQTQKSLYRWTDDHGVVHYGDAMPPDAAKRQRAVLEKNGHVKAVLPSELTPEEVAAKDAAQRAQHAAEARDRSLLMTYNNENDLNNAKKDHLASVDLRIDHEKSAVADSKDKIAKLADKTNSSGVSADEMAELNELVQKQQDDLAAHQRNVVILEQERQLVDAQFTDDLRRFKELKAGTAVGSKVAADK